MQLGDIFYPESLSQQSRLKRPRQVYQIKPAVLTVIDVGKIKVTMAIIGLVEFSYKGC
jgi:hypothetical protein